MKSLIAAPIAHTAPCVCCDGDVEHRCPRVEDHVEPTRVVSLLSGHYGRECGREVGCSTSGRPIGVESEPAGVSDEAAVGGSRFRGGDIPWVAVEERGTDGVVLLRGGNCEEKMPDAFRIWLRGIAMLRAGCELLAFTITGFDDATRFRA